MEWKSAIFSFKDKIKAGGVHLDLFSSRPVLKTGPDVTRCIYFNFGFFGIIMNDKQSV